MIVYLVTNLINGKRYVGVTESTLDERWALHVASSRCPKSRAYRFMSVVRAIAKHGPESFTRKVIETCETSAAMNEAEVRWIAELGTQDSSKGYNLTAGGEATMKGRKHSIEAKARMREAQAKANADPETRRKKSEAAVKSMVRPERRAAIKAGNAKFFENGMPDDVKQKLREAMTGERNANYGKSMPVEVRAKMSASHIGKVLTQEHKAAIARGVVGSRRPFAPPCGARA
jgi:group I intron endonuclease